MGEAAPRAEFFSIYDGAPMPAPASPDLMGAMPVRAAQFCTPIQAASGLGFYLYPPVDFALRWDGRRSEVGWLDEQGRVGEWLALDGGLDVYLPGSDAVPAAVPADRADAVAAVFTERGTPFVNADPRAPHQMEITTGLIARTPAGWGSMIGAVANWPSAGEYEVLEGFVETDWYRGFLPVIVRFTTPGAEVRFFRRLPMARLHLFPLSALRQEGGKKGAVSAGVAGWPDDVWREFVAVRAPRHAHTRPGTYRTASRRAAQQDRCPYPVATARS